LQLATSGNTPSSSGGESSNYAFNYVSGKLKITAAATVVTWDPEAAGVDVKKHITYGTALATTPNTNAKGPDGVAGTITYNININDPRALTVPNHSVTATFTPTSSNYSKSESAKTLNILRRSADVVPQGFDMVYGDDMPSISGTSDEANGGFLDGDGIVTTFKTDAIKGSNVGVYFITAEYEDTSGRLRNYTIKLSSGEENRINVTRATVNIETVNKGSAVNDAQTTLALKLSGLKAEAAVLNGVELTSAQIIEAHGNKEIKIGDKTYNNNDSGLDATVKALNLLVRFSMPMVSHHSRFLIFLMQSKSHLLSTLFWIPKPIMVMVFQLPAIMIWEQIPLEHTALEKLRLLSSGLTVV